MHLYVHVPFCARRCSYCDFAIAVRRETPSAELAELVVREWRSWLDAPWWADAGPVGTIYFGGGTPSRLDPAAIGTILGAIRADRAVAADVEITLEANPDDVSPSAATEWAEHGVNRVSLGVQSFDPGALEWMHRSHGPEQPAVAVRELRAAGIGNVSVDLIYALPERLGRDWEADLDRALGLAPSHLSLYGLTVEAGTPLGKWVSRGTALPMPDPAAEAEYLAAHEKLEASGYRHYEVSNAGRPGFESRHNQAYWSRATYLGLGPSAHSAHGDRRWWNLRDWEAYRRASRSGEPVVAGTEQLTEDQVELERRYLGLRTLEGVPEIRVGAGERARWIEAGWARREGSRLVLTPAGWLRLDALVGRLG